MKYTMNLKLQYLDASYYIINEMSFYISVNHNGTEPFDAKKTIPKCILKCNEKSE